MRSNIESVRLVAQSPPAVPELPSESLAANADDVDGERSRLVAHSPPPSRPLRKPLRSSLTLRAAAAGALLMLAWVCFSVGIDRFVERAQWELAMSARCASHSPPVASAPLTVIRRHNRNAPASASHPAAVGGADDEHALLAAPAPAPGGAAFEWEEEESPAPAPGRASFEWEESPAPAPGDASFEWERSPAPAPGGASFEWEESPTLAPPESFEWSEGEAPAPAPAAATEWSTVTAKPAGATPDCKLHNTWTERKNINIPATFSNTKRFGNLMEAKFSCESFPGCDGLTFDEGLEYLRYETKGFIQEHPPISQGGHIAWILTRGEECTSPGSSTLEAAEREALSTDTSIVALLTTSSAPTAAPTSQAHPNDDGEANAGTSTVCWESLPGVNLPGLFRGSELINSRFETLEDAKEICELHLLCEGLTHDSGLEYLRFQIKGDLAHNPPLRMDGWNAWKIHRDSTVQECENTGVVGGIISLGHIHLVSGNSLSQDDPYYDDATTLPVGSKTKTSSSSSSSSSSFRYMSGVDFIRHWPTHLPYGSAAKMLVRGSTSAARPNNGDFGKALYLSHDRSLVMMDVGGAGCFSRIMISSATEFTQEFRRAFIRVELDGVSVDINLLNCCFGEEEEIKNFPAPLAEAMQPIHMDNAGLRERMDALNTGVHINLPFCFHNRGRISLARPDSPFTQSDLQDIANWNPERGGFYPHLYFDAIVSQPPRGHSVEEAAAAATVKEKEEEEESARGFEEAVASGVLTNHLNGAAQLTRALGGDEVKMKRSSVKFNRIEEHGTIFELRGSAGSVRAITLSRPFDTAMLQAISIRVWCDGMGSVSGGKPAGDENDPLFPRPQIDAPLSLFFVANTLPMVDGRITADVGKDHSPFVAAAYGYDEKRDQLYFVLPMPFWEGITIELAYTEPIDLANPREESANIEVHYSTDREHQYIIDGSETNSIVGYLHLTRTKAAREEFHAGLAFGNVLFEEGSPFTAHSSVVSTMGGTSATPASAANGAWGRLVSIVIHLRDIDESPMESDILIYTDDSPSPVQWDGGFEDFFDGAHGYGYRHYRSGALNGWQVTDRRDQYLQYRTFLEDGVAFTRNIRITLEGYVPRRGSAHDTAVLWYGRRGKAAMIRCDHWSFPTGLLLQLPLPADLPAVQENALRIEATLGPNLFVVREAAAYMGFKADGQCTQNDCKVQNYPFTSWCDATPQHIHPIIGIGLKHGTLSFTMNVPPSNRGVLLRITTSMNFAGAVAALSVNGVDLGDWIMSARLDPKFPDVSLADSNVVVSEEVSGGASVLTIELKVDHERRAEMMGSEIRELENGAGALVIFAAAAYAFTI